MIGSPGAAPDPRLLGRRRSVLEHVQRVGWSPDAPNDVARAALRRPAAFDVLSDADADGCHFQLLLLEYDRLLDRTEFDEHARHEFGIMAATHVVLGHNNAFPMTPEAFTDAARGFQHWNESVLKPAIARILNAKLVEGRDNEWILSHRSQFEPAVTSTLEDARFFPADIEDDHLRLTRGLVMHEEGKVHLSRQPARLDGETCFGWFQLLTNPSRSVASYGPDGLLRIDSLKIKQAADQVFGRTTIPRREELTPEVPDLPQFKQPTPLDDALARDLLEVAQAMACAKGLRARDKRAAEVIRDNLQDLIDGATTLRRLALKTGISRPTLEKAWGVFRERVKRRIA